MSVDVVCVGESMVTFVPSAPGQRLAEAASFARGTGGAESNVACALVQLGHTARWISRVGADPFGDLLLAQIAAAGVDVSAVRRDPDRPTGVYFRTGDGEVAYYRAGSAATALSPAAVGREEAWAGRVLHLSGITAALSAGCADLVRELTAPGPGRPLVSFDVNYRPALWRSGDPAQLAALARRCDLVLVGEDEAEAAWGLPDADAVREALPGPAVLVVKQGALGATAYEGTGAGVFVPAAGAPVVDLVGAGDAFAAGFLSATLRALPLPDRLARGHALAAAAIGVRGDSLAVLGDEAWGRLRA
ncbi:sugar kinase [Streptomyces sp. MI02-7b]|uniref:sugar kinase n=1 Tax=Streptomyces sp. MI02-7b TaxID=462941 RepID=UPI0029AF78AF|nr:sugar kinase [Streptomyces sp. MI02-7b]MDX3072051.1 sugar kinase [Streptomyces sp. MI02-7b]